MRKRIKRLYLHLRYTPSITYLIGVVAAFVVEHTLSNFSAQWGPIAPAVIAVLALVALWILFKLVLDGLQRILKPDPIPMGDKPRPRRALILLLGGRSGDTAPVAIEHHLPVLEHLWLIVTDLTEPISDQLRRKYPDLRAIPLHVLHHYRPEHACSALRQAVDYATAMQIPLSEIICDVTGGTSAMTAGVIEGCLEAGIDIEMVAAQYDLITGEVKQTHDVIALAMHPPRPVPPS
ncbi:MAG: hypothetical protein GXP38_12545 [Chloroflexi bacterium]|nr:hypothetical protein [Chloroflexota bacterium]